MGGTRPARAGPSRTPSEVIMRRMVMGWRWWIATMGLAMVGGPGLRGQEPAAKDDRAEPAWAKQMADSIKPLPPEPVPDNPPPHEGNLIELSYRIAPPDLLLVEVLEGLPGRPITGEKLVRQDGTISLGWYGDVHVAGLTPSQAKVKIVLHLRRFITDVALGLIAFDERGALNRDGEIAPLDKFPPAPTVDELGQRADVPEVEMPPLPGDPDLTVRRKDQGGKKLGEAAAPKAEHQDPFEPLKDRIEDAAIPKIEIRGLPSTKADVLFTAPVGRYVYVEPAKTSRVFVEVAALNSKIYYVQGDVAKPGRLPYTGNETVFDALAFAGGLLHSGDPRNIHLNRPARGNQPRKTFLIDYTAIERGDKTANLQILPGDRLIIERKDEFPPRL